VYTPDPTPSPPQPHTKAENYLPCDFWTPPSSVERPPFFCVPASSGCMSLIFKNGNPSTPNEDLPAMHPPPLKPPPNNHFTSFAALYTPHFLDGQGFDLVFFFSRLPGRFCRETPSFSFEVSFRIFARSRVLLTTRVQLNSQIFDGCFAILFSSMIPPFVLFGD